MLIGENWRLRTSDDSNLLLEHQVINTRSTAKNKDRWAFAGYFGTPESALHWLVNQEIRDTNLSDLNTIVAKIDELHKIIDSLNPADLPRLKITEVIDDLAVGEVVKERPIVIAGKKRGRPSIK